VKFRTGCRKAALSAFAASMVLAGTPTNAQQQPPKNLKNLNKAMAKLLKNYPPKQK